MIKLCDFISKDRICFLKSETKDEALEEIINVASNNNLIIDKVKFKEEILERERLLSTGIGREIAIPHVKSDIVKNFFITIGISKKGIHWNSIDNLLVKIIFLIAGPDEHKKYLRIISRLMLYIKNKKHIDDILKASNKDEIYNIFLEG